MRQIDTEGIKLRTAYECERRGKVAGNYGFVAFRFGNAQLDGLLKDTVKPGLRETLGFDLVDMRDVATAWPSDVRVAAATRQPIRLASEA